MLNVLKYLASILLFFLGLTSENLKAEICFQEEKGSTHSYESNFQFESSEREWLGLLYPQEESQLAPASASF